MVYSILGKDEKNTQKNLYLLSLKTSFWKSSRDIFCTVYPNRNPVTTHPGFGNFQGSLGPTSPTLSGHMGIIARKPVFGGFANNIGADQPAHPHSLISAFAIVSYLDLLIFKFLGSLCT